MKRRGRSRSAGLVLGVVALVGVCVLLGAVALASERVTHAVRYRPAAVVARPAGEVALVPGAFAIRDFDGDSTTLYLLDPLAPAVRVLRRSEAGWRPAGSFGRRGGGPGEFTSPTGLALLRDGRVAVAEPGRIHFFTGAGGYLESTAPSLPCPVPLPQLAGAARGLFIHGTCLRRGGVTDTMEVVLFWSPDGTEAVPVVTDPRFTTDGRFGTPYGADSGLSDGATHHLFGAGSSGCVYRIAETDSIPRVQRECGPDLQPYRLELSPRTRSALDAARRRNPQAAGALRIPATHPLYVERVVLPSGDAWLRGWSEDSLVLRYVAGGTDLAVLPYSGLLGCRRSGCMWSDITTEGVRVRIVPLATLDSVARAAVPGAAQ